MPVEASLTDAVIYATKVTAADQWLSDGGGARGIGRLLLRINSAGVRRFYFRCTVDGRRRMIPLGIYSMTNRKGYLTLDQARALASNYTAQLVQARPKRSISPSAPRAVIGHLLSTATRTPLSEFDELPDLANVRLRVVAALFSISPATVWRWTKSGALPKALHIGGATLWNVGELRDTLVSRLASR